MKISFINLISFLILFFPGKSLWAQNNIDFNYNLTDNCVPSSLSLMNISNVTGTKGNPVYHWYINGEFYSKDQHPEPLNFSEAGFYTLELRVYDDEDMSFVGSSPGYNINLFTKFTDFYVSSMEACPDEKIIFEAPSGTDYVEWIFGNTIFVGDNNRYQSRISHSFSKSGNYDVKLVANGPCGTDTIVKTIVVKSDAIPLINIYSSPMPVCPNDQIIFEVSGNYTSVFWEFGDGQTSNMKSVAHTYPDKESATYYAKVTVTNSCGGTNTDSVEVIIASDLLTNADFNFFPVNGYTSLCPLVEIQFKTSARGNFTWDFGDGEKSFIRNPVHRYTKPGDYVVTLSSINGCGSKESLTKTVSVDFAEDYLEFLFFEIENHYGEDIIVCPGELLRFRNYSHEQKELLFEWNFGDGTIKREREAIHFYNEPGDYTVTLTARSFCGGEASYEALIQVADNLTPDDVEIGIVPLFICPGEKVFFFDNNYNPDRGYIYDFIFGDGQELMDVTKISNLSLFTLAEHVYDNPGVYNYTVKVRNSCGNSTDINGVINVEGDLSTKPFYYISNSTLREDMVYPEDWSNRQSITDHEFSVTVRWPAWQPSYGNEFHLWLWYGGFDTGKGDNNTTDGPGYPSGYVKFNSDNILEGEKVTFFAPISPLYPPTLGIAAGYFCGGEMNFDEEPEAWGTLTDTEGNVIHQTELRTGGITNLDDISNGGIVINPDYNGYCRKDSPNGTWYREIEPGVYAVLRLNVDFQQSGENNYYEMFYTDKPGNLGVKSYISSGKFTGSGEINQYETLWLEDNHYCIIPAEYHITRNENEITFLPVSFDNCDNRSEFLNGTFIKLTNEMISEGAACPGDPVRFIIAGGMSYLWNFGEGVTSTEQYPEHIFNTPGRFNVELIVTNGCGRKDTLYTTVMVSEKNIPDVSINYFPQSLRNNDTIYFNGSQYDKNEHLSDLNTYHWDFGDGNTSNLKAPKHVYQREGKYEVTFTSSNGCGSKTTSMELNVLSGLSECVARFSFSISERNVTFTDQSAGGITEWQWDFGDGNSSHLQNPEHIYKADGAYIVTLTVQNKTSKCITSLKRKVIVGNLPCEADFIHIINNNTGLTSFSSTVINADKYYWDFGDGNFSTDKDPQHTFSRFGIYTVCLTAWDDETKCMVKSCENITYGDKFTTGIKPDFSYIIDHATKTISFTELSTITDARWYWTMGDGAVMSAKNSVYTYKKSGQYEVCMNMYQENAGRSFKVCKIIPVGEDACGLKLMFSHFTDPGKRTVVFRNESTGTITDWFWDFGDGSTSTHKSPEKEYNKSGLYLVTLSARNENNGCIDQYSSIIQVGSTPCKAEFSYDFNPANNTIRFRNESLANTANYYWDFGDGNYSSDINPVHTYEKPGLYYASLTISDNNRLCIDKTFKAIQAGEVDCGAKFDVFVDSITNTAYFSNRAYGDATHLLWIFGDGTYSTEHNPVHTFTIPGYYSVSLNTYDSRSECMDHYSEKVVISQIGNDSKADFAFRPNPNSGLVEFKNLSLGDIDKFHWDFGDGGISDLENPVYTFEKPGYKLVCLSVTNTAGIPDMKCSWIPVNLSQTTNCSADFLFNVDPQNKSVVFTDNSIGSPDSWEWDFGDSITSEDKNPRHTYAESGYYGVKLVTVNSETGCRSLTYKLLNVAEEGALQGGFSFEIDSVNKKVSGYPVDFVGASSGDGSKYEWDFGEREQPTKKSDFIIQYTGSYIVRYVYSAPGTYTACMRVSNPNQGTSHTSCMTVSTGWGINVPQTPAEPLKLEVYPNPLNENTQIDFMLPSSMFVEIVIIDNHGRSIETLVRNNKDAGEYNLYWNALQFSPGIYYLKMTTKHGITVKPLVISR